MKYFNWCRDNKQIVYTIYFYNKVVKAESLINIIIFTNQKLERNATSLYETKQNNSGNTKTYRRRLTNNYYLIFLFHLTMNTKAISLNLLRILTFGFKFVVFETLSNGADAHNVGNCASAGLAGLTGDGVSYIFGLSLTSVFQGVTLVPLTVITVERDVVPVVGESLK